MEKQEIFQSKKRTEYFNINPVGKIRILPRMDFTSLYPSSFFIEISPELIEDKRIKRLELQDDILYLKLIHQL